MFDWDDVKNFKNVLFVFEEYYEKKCFIIIG